MKAKKYQLLKEKGDSVLLSRFAVTHILLIRGTHKGTHILLVARQGGASLSLEVTAGHGRGLYTVSIR